LDKLDLSIRSMLAAFSVIVRTTDSELRLVAVLDERSALHGLSQPVAGSP
jgi:hypothetical protein